ncbi:hypothetical protein UPYG_G00179330 [Umbra pygmaea]|uniref:Fish-egg lectin-like n=1 Tax=Umbra pygmaea TaxID=75934 RepID=A0ABD0WQ99_UMBPY
MRASVLVLLVPSILAAVHAWDCQEVKNIKNLMQIDASLGLVVAIDVNQIPYYLQRGLIRDDWIRMPGLLKHITVGPAGTWGVDRADTLFQYIAGKWVQVEGTLKQVDAGGDLIIVGANWKDKPFCLRSSATVGYKRPGSPLPWTELPGSVKYYSCGPFGCWAVNKDDSIFFMSLSRDCRNNGWNDIDTKLSMIEVATDGSVFGVNSKGDVYTRDGITAKKPKGTRWSFVPLKKAMKHVSYDQGRLWAVSQSGVTFSCSR